MLRHDKVIFAPGINTGGGLTLFKSIEQFLLENDVFAILDERIKPYLQEEMTELSVFFPPGLIGRIKAEWFLFRNIGRHARVLCFSNIAPVFYTGHNVAIFFQNLALISKTIQADRALPGAILFSLKRAVSKLLLPKTGEYFVQTESVKQALIKAIGINSSRVSVFPFFPADNGNMGHSKSRNQHQFLYVASDEPHKNHWVLIRAWQLLKEEGCSFRLVLTLDGKNSLLWKELEAFAEKHELDVINSGLLSPDKLYELYHESEALIYPSLLESFGLPLIEAKAYGLDIIAGELDYVRDVCIPCETFDAKSPLSICRAVLRYTGSPANEAQEIYSPGQFVNRVYKNAN